MPLHFDADSHTYTLNGHRLPSVTQVLSAAGLVDDEWFTEQSRERGRFVHKAILYDEREGLDESSVDDRLRGYLTAYRAFKRDVQPGPCLVVEQPFADPTLRFAGTPDQLRPVRERLTLLDIKSGTPSPTHPLQTAAYVRLLGLQDAAWGRAARAALYLKNDGTYRLVTHADRTDWKVFQAALTLCHFKEAA